MWHEEVQAFAKRVQQLTGRRLRRRALKEAIRLLNRRTDLLRRLMDLRWSQPSLLSGQDTFVVIQASFLADPAWWVDKTEQLIHELEQRHDADNAAEQVRILVTGSPVLFPDLSLLHLIEQRGAVIVADEMCSGTQRLYNPTVMDEPSVSGMLRAAAEKTLLPCTCPCFVSSNRRIDRILELVQRSGAQGVIHHTLRLCQLYDMEVPRVAAALKENGLPLLSIHAEYSTDGAAALKNRVDAFLEMLQQS
jgi:benzoyl-CoA reductase/2-hydroxyglutaryl-CoA dehydratase subunit BcrC/BadD/HgdB